MNGNIFLRSGFTVIATIMNMTTNKTAPATATIATKAGRLKLVPAE